MRWERERAGAPAWSPTPRAALSPGSGCPAAARAGDAPARRGSDAFEPVLWPGRSLRQREVSGKGKEGPLPTARSEIFEGEDASDPCPSPEVFVFPPRRKLCLLYCCQKGFPGFAVPSLTVPAALLLSLKPCLDLRTWGWSLQPLLFPLPPFPLSQFPAGPHLAWRCRHRRSCYLGAHTPASTLRRPRTTTASRIAGCASHPVSFWGHRPLSGQPQLPMNEAPPDCQLPLAPESG